MLKPSKKLALALEAVTEIAASRGPEPVQSGAIAKRLGLPRRYLEQVMQQLVRAGVLKGVRGPRGGYRLARERAAISVGEVLRIVQGADAEAGFGDDQVESTLSREVIGPLFDKAAQDVLRRFDAVSIEDLCRAAAPGPEVRRERRGAAALA
jgi:Rrf2 family transcriptional regulator, iron-sulfur cluster assembly transcription factor